MKREKGKLGCVGNAAFFRRGFLKAKENFPQSIFFSPPNEQACLQFNIVHCSVEMFNVCVAPSYDSGSFSFFTRRGEIAHFSATPL